MVDSDDQSLDLNLLWSSESAIYAFYVECNEFMLFYAFFGFFMLS